MNKLIKQIKYIFCGRTNNNLPRCSIEDINLINKKIIIVHHGIHNTKIKLTFNDIIEDPIILYNLSPLHSALIGYYYIISGAQLKKSNKNDNFSVYSNDESSPFNILGLNRRGYLLYVNRETGETCQSLPLTILNDQNLLNQFNSLQANYIGILGGRMQNKIRGASHNSQPLLKIVK